MGAPINIAGQKFGRWLVLKLATSGNGRTWLCRCDCGTERAVPTSALRIGASSSCGCKRLDDLTGIRFGRYLVLKRAANSRTRITKWLCRCDCGLEKSVAGSALKSGIVVSCGCYIRDQKRTHGLSKHPLYSTWYKMMARCFDTNDRAYYRYGGRGISVCKEWATFPAQFFSDIGEKPPGTELDRIDNNGNYEPANCRWATPRQQSNNRRSNRFIKFRGKSKTIMEWERDTGINRRTITQRLDHGWPVARILTTKVKP